MIGGIVIGILIAFIGWAIFQALKRKFFEEVRLKQLERCCWKCRHYEITDMSCNKHGIKVLRGTSCVDWRE